LNQEIAMYKDYPAAYQVSKGAALQVDAAFYDRIRQAQDSRTLVEQFEVPIRTARAWKVKAGQVFRVTTPVGPQVGDFNVWNADDPRERMWAARTRQLQGAHVTTHDRLWSNLPFLRPMVTITDDSLASYGIDEHGGRLHDLLGTRCDPYVNRMLTGEDFHHHCHSNLTRAVLPHGLTEFDVHDVLNIFQCTGLNHDDMYFMKACPAQKGDYLEFFAEIDLLCALSTASARRPSDVHPLLPGGRGSWLADDLARSASKACERDAPDPPRRLTLLPVPGRSLASQAPTASARIKSRRRNSPKLLEELV
jgi:uncharacterized protein YcgI (DUF1989 family)